MSRPNIFFLMADQMQARVLEPDHVCQTPPLDRLRFTRAYTPNNICSPTRASLMTGLLREPANVADENTLAMTQRVVWDGAWKLAADQNEISQK